MRTDFSKFDEERVPTPDICQLLDALVPRMSYIDFVGEIHKEAKALRERLEKAEDDTEREAINKKLARFKVTERQKYVLIAEKALELAESMGYGFLKYNEAIYIYNGGYWEQASNDLLSYFLGRIAERAGIRRYDARQFSVIEYLRLQFYSSSFRPLDNPGTAVRINLANGTYVIDGDERGLREHRKEDFLRYKLPFKYDPEADCPMFKRYLDTVLPDKTAQAVLMEYIGYCFARRLKLEKCLMLYGSGANGKGVFFEIIRALLGKENVSTFQMRHLCEDNGYYRAKICDKLINYSSEKGEDFNGETFKILASGEPVSARLPYKEPFEVTDYARMILNANRLPVPAEQGEAFYRRFIIIPFSVTIPREERDPDLAAKITRNELSGIFNMVLEGLDRILEHRDFTRCEAIDKALEAYKAESDSVTSFLREEGYIPSASERIERKTLYGEYRSFCADNGYKWCGNGEFGKRLENNHIQISRSHGVRYVYVEKRIEEDSL